MAARSAFEAYKTKSKLRGLSQLLGSWLRVLGDFCVSTGFEYNPWWFNERATLSTLAAAAWRLNRGWTALEEFSTEKRGIVPNKKVEDGKISRGRCDLYISHRSTDFAIEAKQAWQAIGKRAHLDKVGEAMSRAKRDAGNLMASEAEFRLGVAFTVPYFQSSEVKSTSIRSASEIDKRAVRGIVTSWTNSLNLSRYDAYAYYFPWNCSEFLGKSGRLFPGVLMTASICKTGTRRTN